MSHFFTQKVYEVGVSTFLERVVAALKQPGSTIDGEVQKAKDRLALNPDDVFLKAEVERWEVLRDGCNRDESGFSSKVIVPNEP